MTLRAEVVDLVRPDLLDDHRQARGVGQVGVVEMEPLGDGRLEREEVVDPLAVQAAGAADQAVDLVVRLAQEQLGEVGAVLAGDTRDQGAFHGGGVPVVARGSRHGR